MNKENQRIAIAEACGWTASLNYGSMGGWITRDPSGNHGYDAIGGTRDGAFLRSCPDYLNDLNAMHEAEKVLTDDDHKTYRSWLVVVCYGQHWLATAEKRAEAFLRTIGKWSID